MLSLLVLLFFIWSGLSIIIRVEDLFGELDAKLAFLDPWCLRLELHIRFLQLELREDEVLVDARNHVWRLDEREAEGRLQMD